MASSLAGSEWQGATGYTVRVLAVSEEGGRLVCWWEYRGARPRSEVAVSEGDAGMRAVIEALLPALDADADERALAGLEV
jgi:hypothetical protein